MPPDAHSIIYLHFLSNPRALNDYSMLRLVEYRRVSVPQKSCRAKGCTNCTRCVGFCTRKKASAFGRTCPHLCRIFYGCGKPHRTLRVVIYNCNAVSAPCPSQSILKRCSLFLLKSFIRTTLRKCRNPAYTADSCIYAMFCTGGMPHVKHLVLHSAHGFCLHKTRLPSAVFSHRVGLCRYLFCRCGGN